MTETVRLKKDGTPKKKPGRIPDPNKPPKRTPMYYKGVERPFMWKIGEDAGKYKHDMYLPWLRAKAQANFREEGWEMSFEEFFELWNGKWEQRGRGVDDLCMSRIDANKPWSKINCVIITRREYLKFHNESQRGKRKPRKPKYTKMKKDTGV